MLITGFTSPMASKLEYRRPGCKVTCAPLYSTLVNTCNFLASSFKTIELAPLGKVLVRSGEFGDSSSSSYKSRHYSIIYNNTGTLGR